MKKKIIISAIVIVALDIAAFDQDKGNKVIEAGDADLVAYGKPFVSNPDLVARFENNLELPAWNQDTFYTTGAKGYSDYPKASK